MTLPKTLQAIALNQDTAQRDVFLNREQFARLLGTTSVTAADWYSKGKLTSNYVDASGRRLIAWADLAAALRHAIGAGLFEGLRAASQPGPKKKKRHQPGA